ncbi:large subunit GTPase 1 homolog [Mizuhopecten yessoensis]|uniref:Large subunit GTPase 1 homolog n=1 Tax=Mizuhopecten yessoensis TaxID=6573 RepID=A0A210QDI7_MIZYE|nr:large subunit GTPase 1 homolog [Mizuhopecten yessoensis]OWF46782.1 Large subunit GTPase 1-like [Mizuhopecten yessoensis]
MGKKKQAVNLGKSLISNRFGKRKPASRGTDRENFLHTSELQDGYDWGRLNLQSVTEQSNLEDFLSTAELAGTEFTAEKQNITFVDRNQPSGLLSAEEQKEIEELQQKHRNVLKIPRRPAWNSTTTPEELDRQEKDAFLEWRRSLARLQEIEGIELTPYEKNLDFWRQLWRVIERSDVIVQIVDARNPLLFRCEDLEAYIKEVDPNKQNLILINKADYLTAPQRELWYQYFKERGVQVAFWSALEETARQNEEKEKEEMDELNKESEEEDDESDDGDDDEEEDITERLQNQINEESSEMMDRQQEDCSVSGEGMDKECVTTETEKDMDTGTADDDSENSQSQKTTDLGKARTVTMETDLTDNDAKRFTDDTQDGATGGDCDNCCESVKSSNCSEGGGKILNGLELLDLFRTLHTGKKHTEGQTTMGMVGYPNVGKSSSINAILRTKKVPVSATPGRTKHFQTLFVESDLMLCDCPGLVFPSFVSTKADLVVNGILPIDQMRDHAPPTSLICQLIPKSILEETYSINLPEPAEGQDPNRCPTERELLNVYGYMRGYMTANGLPDCPRTSRYILKDFVNGKLLYCNPPPDVDEETFQPTRTISSSKKRAADHGPMSVPSRLDKEFFAKPAPKIHAKGVRNVKNYTRIEGLNQVGAESSVESSDTSSDHGSMQTLIVDKPWKRHHNRGKKEKLRKTFSHHDDVGKY